MPPLLSDRLFDATERLSVERGRRFWRCCTPPIPTPATIYVRGLTKVAKARGEALRTSIAALKRFEFPELSDLGEKNRAHICRSLSLLRPKVRRPAAKLSLEARDRDLFHSLVRRK